MIGEECDEPITAAAGATTATVNVPSPSQAVEPGDNNGHEAVAGPSPPPEDDDARNGEGEGPVGPWSAATTAAASPSQHRPPDKKRWSVPESPRWRFVSQAKKTEGYSSVAAGTVVEGISADELVDASKVREGSVAKTELINSRDQWERKVEMAAVAAASSSSASSPAIIMAREHNRTVGRLGAREGSGDVVEETFEFAAPGRRDAVNGDEEEGLSAPSVREEGTGGASEFREEREERDEENRAPAAEDANNTQELLASAQEDARSVEGLSLSSARHDAMEEVAEEDDVVAERTTGPEEIAAVKTVPAADDDDELDRAEKQEAPMAAEMGRKGADDDPDEEIEPMPDDPAPLPSSPTSEVSPKPATADDRPRQPSRKTKIALLLLLLAVAITGTIIGVLLGGKKSGDDNDDAMDRIASPDDNNNVPPAEVSSRSPSRSPAGYCPAGSKLFSVRRAENARRERSATTSETTWAVKDACTGEEVLRCSSPCSDGIVALPTPSPTPRTTTSSPTPSPTPVPSARRPAPDTVADGPTENPSAKHDADESCIGNDERPRPVRDGERFRFNLLGTNSTAGRDDGQCVDGDGRLYERGEFDDVGE